MAKRLNTGKVPLAHVLYMPNAMKELAQVMEYGEKKYNSPAMEKGWLDYDPEETLQSLTRHLTSHMNGEVFDKESGLPHMASVLFNAAAYIEQCYNLVNNSAAPLDDSGNKRPGNAPLRKPKN